jgi:hypothetical protein
MQVFFHPIRRWKNTAQTSLSHHLTWWKGKSTKWNKCWIQDVMGAGESCNISLGGEDIPKPMTVGNQLIKCMQKD